MESDGAEILTTFSPAEFVMESLSFQIIISGIYTGELSCKYYCVDWLVQFLDVFVYAFT